MVTWSNNASAFSGVRDPYAIDEDDLVVVDMEDADGQSPKEGSKGSAPSKRRSKREVSRLCSFS